jgi:putative endonuclease
MYYTYVVRSLKDNRFYTGFARDLKQRFEQHQKGRIESTKDRRPLVLIYYEACLDQKEATKREKYLKTVQRENVSKESAQILFNRVNPQYRMLNVKTGFLFEVQRWTFDVERSDHYSDSCLLTSLF